MCPCDCEVIIGARRRFSAELDLGYKDPSLEFKVFVGLRFRVFSGVSCKFKISQYSAKQQARQGLLSAMLENPKPKPQNSKAP